MTALPGGGEAAGEELQDFRNAANSCTVVHRTVEQIHEQSRALAGQAWRRARLRSRGRTWTQKWQ